jgi:hypothetical protein
MWIYDPLRKCSTCGIKDVSFFAQPQTKKIKTTGKMKTSIIINNMCHFCKKKQVSGYYYKNEKMRRYNEYKNNMYTEERV